jgi:hypothetical protein
MVVAVVVAQELKTYTLLKRLYAANGLYAAINMAYNNATNSIIYNFLNNVGTYSGCTAYVVIEYTKK